MQAARLARRERRVQKRRSLTSTLPADMSQASHAWVSDRPGWCVDLGPTLAAMTTCDVWLALAKGELTPETKVWREGMPYWDALAKVPEFALALPDTDVLAPLSGVVAKQAEPAIEAEPISEERPAGRAHRPANTPAREAHAMKSEELMRLDEPLVDEPLVTEVATMAPPSDFTTPAPVVVEETPELTPSAHSSRRWLRRVDRGMALSVAIGAAVAILALALATTGPGPSDTNSTNHLDSKVSAGSAPERGTSVSDTLVTRLPAFVDEAPAAQGNENALEEREKERLPRGPHAADRGQQRGARLGDERAERRLAGCEMAFEMS